ncbi:uncharacterized protein VTP21DRAFT_11463 [Calcarisporiella thermophila]|uniref:uncharacterized protein n=1 Tax=Calcarisporiella thermophila TaxID=911321 RepID=UPI0037426285
MTTRQRVINAIRKGETYELKSELNSEYPDRRKEAVKRVIANMTVGKDVSSLFPDVLKNMQTEDLELKKLVYLYLINYAKSQPELVILAVNTFVKDTDDTNPLIRALAMRTMGCLRVNKIVDYLCDPLRKCLRDEDPYVRKTACLCVAKLHDLDPTLVFENEFVDRLKEMVSDSNPTVVANAIVALQEIQESCSKPLLVVNTPILNKLLVALNECTEWGQIAILSVLADYRPVDSKEAEYVCERVLPRLSHANGSVVLATIKVLLIYMRRIRNGELTSQLLKKMTPPLVTLLASAPEFQYVALRNINLILQKQPDLLAKQIRVFFCKYNDPPYVKSEKLEILTQLCSESNVDQLLSELKEYANEVDVDFVRRAVRTIGRCAVKIEAASERCINVLLDLVNTKVNYVVQEAIIVIKDIFRKYPNRFEGIIPTLCENIDLLDLEEAKASLIWIIGEYAEQVVNGADIIESLLEGFPDENVQVQLQLLTATVKLFLKQPNSAQDLVQRVLKLTTECDNSDLRDRAYIYWRLLSTDPQAAKAVVLAEKPPIVMEEGKLSGAVLEEMIDHIGSISSVYHKPPETFLGGKYGADRVKKSIDQIHREEEESNQNKGNLENLLDLEFGESLVTDASPSTTTAPSKGGVDELMDIFGGGSGSGSSVVNPTPLGSKPKSNDLQDLLF